MVFASTTFAVGQRPPSAPVVTNNESTPLDAPPSRETPQARDADQAAPLTTPATSQPQRFFIQTPQGPFEITDQNAQLLYSDFLEIKAALEKRGPERKQAIENYFHYKPVSRAEIGLTFANYFLGLWMGLQIAMGFSEDPTTALTAVAFIPPTLWITDFVSGIFHKFLDSYASESNRFWGNPAREFRVHHEFPSNLNHLSYIDNNASFAKLLVPLYATAAFADMSPDVASSVLLSLILFSNGSEIHRQSHLSNPSSWVRSLQDLRIILNRRDHMRHHQGASDSDFGIVNGWSNRFATKFKIEERMDRLYWKTLRKLPNNWIQKPSSIPPQVLQDLTKDLSLVPQRLLVSVLMYPQDSSDEVKELIKLWLERHFLLQNVNQGPVSCESLLQGVGN